MITKKKINLSFCALCLFVGVCFLVFCEICNDEVDALYFSFMIYASLRFMKVAE